MRINGSKIHYKSLNLAFQVEQSEIVICPEDICECLFLIWKTMENSSSKITLIEINLEITWFKSYG